MTDARAPAAAAWSRTLLYAAATAALTVIAAQVLFSAFMFYDDEGYVLISLRNFAEHGGLYREIYSQYGPFPFVAWFGLHALGVPIDHASGRIVTLLAWIVTAVACAAIVQRATRQVTAGLVVLAATFAFLWVMASEPAHPGGIIGVLVALAGAIGYHFLAAGRTRAWAVAVGAFAGALVLTKINVGGFATLAGLAWILGHHRSDAVRRWTPAILALGTIVVPLVLMRQMLHEPWILAFVVLYVPAALAAVLAFARAGEPRVGWETLGTCVVSGLAVTVIVVGVVILRGASFGDVLDGVLLGPLRTPAAFNFAYRWPVGAREFAMGSLILCVVAHLMRGRAGPRLDTVVAWGRLAVVLALAWAVIRLPAASPDRPVVSYGAACLWLFFWPLAGENLAARSARAWLGLLLLGQYLHVYPVAGSQLAWATFLSLPVAALGAADACRFLRERAGPALRPALRLPAWAGSVVLAVFALAIGYRFSLFGARYRVGSDLRLPGVEFVRVPTPTAAAFRLLTANASVYADVLFSEPGMFSYNLWSGVPPPTRANVTHWFSLLNVERQRAIMAALEQHPRACVIVQRMHIDFLTQRSFAPSGELHDYIAKHFTTAFTIDGFEFRVRNGRTIDPLLLGELLIRPDATAGRDNALLQLRLLGPLRGPVARVEIVSITDPAPPLVLDADTARVALLPTNVEGAPIATARPAAWPFQVAGPTTVQFHFDRFRSAGAKAGNLIILRDAAGEEVALARLSE